MKIDELIQKCSLMLANAVACKQHVSEETARRELRELRRFLTKELREPKKT